MESKKEMILKYLKERGKLSTTRIAFLIGCHYYQAEKFIKELEKEKLIVCMKTNNATYWRTNETTDNESIE